MKKIFIPKTILTHDNFLEIGRGYYYNFVESQDSRFSAVSSARKIEARKIWNLWIGKKLESTSSAYILHSTECPIIFKSFCWIFSNILSST